MLVIFVLLPDKYFSMTLMPLKARQQFSNLNKKENKIEENQEEENKEDEIIVNKINDINVDINDENYKENQHLIGNKKEVLKEEDNESLFEDIQIVNNEDIRKESILVHLKVLIKSPIYLLFSIIG